MFIASCYVGGIAWKTAQASSTGQALASTAGREDAHRCVPWSSLRVCAGAQAPATQLAVRDRPGSPRRRPSELCQGQERRGSCSSTSGRAGVSGAWHR